MTVSSQWPLAGSKACPTAFLWGTSLAAHQVEGDNYHSNWWRWEQRPGRIRDGSTSQTGAGHYERFEADFEMARLLGCRALLFSLEWSRIEPREGHFDAEALKHYAAVFDALKRHELEPMCVLRHGTTPLWFAERYGWSHRKAAECFARYAKCVAENFGPLCRWWIPVFEPMFEVAAAYLEGVWPPDRLGQSQKPFLRLLGVCRAPAALQNLARAHAAAYHIIHAQRPDALVGVSVRGRLLDPLDDRSAWDVRTARREHHRANHLLVRVLIHGRRSFPIGAEPLLKGTADFIGVSYYGKETVRFTVCHPERLFALRTDSRGRPVPLSHVVAYPEGLRVILKELAEYGLPLVVTGNGIAAEDDALRCRYLLDHVAVLGRCLREGLNVRGYFHRSLLDGFEWEEGYALRYGLVHVDRETLARTPNPSAFLYKDICETGELRAGAVARFCPGWRDPEEGT